MVLSPIDTEHQRRHKRRNALQSLLLLGGMVLLLAACGWIVAGVPGVIWAVVLGVFGVIMNARISPELMLRFIGAAPLPLAELQDLHRVFLALADRAGLEEPPELYYVSSPKMTAFSVGSRESAAIAMTSALLRALDLRELAGVLAHEFSHVRHNDMWIMGLANMVRRLTGMMSMLGMFLLVLNLPLMMAGAATVPLPLVLLLVFAPTIGILLQLALSRIREFEADIDAAGLTGDPVGLASALEKLEASQGGGWEGVFLPGPAIPVPSLFRTHPTTSDRVKRLLDLRRGRPERRLEIPDHLPHRHSIIPVTVRRPRGPWGR